AMLNREPNAMIVDVREPEEYQTGHVPGAINLPQAELASRLEELPKDKQLLLVCQSGMRSVRSAQFLRQAGFSRAGGGGGGPPAWAAAGRPLAPGGLPIKPLRVVESLWSHAGASSAPA